MVILHSKSLKILSAIVISLVFAFTLAEEHHTHEQHDFLTRLDLSMTVPLHVVFVGFEELEPDLKDFDDLLEELLPKHSSHIENGQPLLVKTRFRYVVTHIWRSDPSQLLQAWEAAVSSHIARVTINSGKENDIRSGVPVPVPIPLVPGGEFSVLAERILNTAGISSPVHPRGIIFINTGIDTAKTPYYFTSSTMYGCKCTQSFVGEGRAIAVDLASGPCRLGRVDSHGHSYDGNEGAVLSQTWPKVPKMKSDGAKVTIDGEEQPHEHRHYRHRATERDSHTGTSNLNKREQQVRALRLVRQGAMADLFRDHESSSPSTASPSRSPSSDYEIEYAWFESRLAAAVVKAVKTVFAPDIAVTHRDKETPRIVVPILVFRSEGDGEEHVDVAKIKSTVEKLISPGQTVSIIVKYHTLSSQPHIELALAKSYRSDTMHAVDDNGAFRAVTRDSIDSKTLLSELRTTASVLLAGEISASDSRALFNDIALSSSSSSDDVPALIDDSDGEEEHVEDVAVDDVKGSTSHVFPIYVISLSGSGENTPLLLDGDKSVVTDAHCGVVIEYPYSTSTITTHSSIPLFNAFGNSKLQKVKLDMSSNMTTTHIINALCQTVGGISKNGFSTYYSPHHSKLVRDDTFSVGFHPFAPLGLGPGSHYVSKLMVDLALRNTIVYRVSNSLSILKKTVREVERFGVKYLVSDKYDYNYKTGHGKASIERLYHDQESSNQKNDRGRDKGVGRLPLAAQTIRRLHDDLLRFEALFRRVEGILEGSTTVNVGDAYSISSELVSAAAAYQDYALREIHTARNYLSCCRKRVVNTASTGASGSIWISVIVIMALIGIVFFVRKRQ